MGELVNSHISPNFDRSGYAEDLNVLLPLDRLHELASEGVIASVARYHYSFMGAADIKRLKSAAQELAERLKADDIDAVLLVPI